MFSALFGQRSFKDEIRKNKQEIRQAQREIVRQKIQLEKQKIEHENQLKAAASRGDQKVLRQSAKNIIHTYNQINRLGEMDAQLSTLQSTMINMTSQQSMTPAVVNMSRMMTRTNRMMPVNGMARVGRNFEKSMTIASIKQEMMDEIMNSAFEDENDEEETDNMVEAILNEMHITVANKMRNAQGHETITSGRKIKMLTTTDADLEARLNALRHRKWIKPRRLNILSRSQNPIRDDRCRQFRTFTQKVDHFGFANMDTYLQRYTLNVDHWESGKPIFFYAGNEGDIDLFCDNTGFMWDIAPLFNAMVVFAEHRYYGQSLPYGNASYSKPEYTTYLTSGQALADYAYLIEHIRSTIKGAEESPTIVFGGSYGGMLAAYFRIKYPHIVAGAHAASAPILQMTTPCESFSRIVTQDFHAESSQCVDIIRSSWAAINRIGSTSSGLEQLTSLFKLCRPLKSVDELKNWLLDMYGNTAMVDYPYPTSFLADLPAFPARVFCSNVTSPSFKTINDDEDIVKRIVKGTNVFFNYTGHTECFDTGSQGSPSLGDLGWSYQSCTEFVMPMCSDGVNDMFEKQSWDFQAFSDGCFAQWSVRPRLEWPYIEFGGKNLTDFRYDTNIAFTNGNLDPWSAGGVRTTVAPTLPAILITGGAHHLDLRSANKADPPSVLAARQEVVALIQKWIL